MLRRPSIALLTVLGASAVALSPACKPSARIEDRSLDVYSIRSCPLDANDAFAVIYGNGDFDDTQGNVLSSLFLRDVGSSLSELPESTRSVIADVTQQGGRFKFQGIADVPAAGPVKILVWDQAGTCTLQRDVESRTDVTFGVFGRHLMVVGGKSDVGTPNTYVGDLATGLVTDLPIGLGTRRSHATITAFRESDGTGAVPALIAGGESTASPNEPLDSAELYEPMIGADGDIGDFVATHIELSEIRSQHGAAVLSTGETLLVGGRGQFGALQTMEIIDPKTRRYRTKGVANLDVPRTDPTVLKLASGEIFVAGGFGERSAVIDKLEWFSANASVHSRSSSALGVSAVERSFVPLSAGGVLAVVRPGEGVTDFQTVWVISADGKPEPGLPIDPQTLTAVRLFEGTDGAPVLWTGTRWMRWQPWAGAFQPIPNAPTRGPRSTAVASGDPGLALWVDDRQEDPREDTVLTNNQAFIRGYRFAAKSRFGTVANPLLVSGTDGLAPDRLAGSLIKWDPAKGLQLSPATAAFVTDVTYADVSIEIDAALAPNIVLRQADGREIEVGGKDCPIRSGASVTRRVDRVGSSITTSDDGGDARACPGGLDPSARVSIGVRGAANLALSFAHNLRITRR